jgi:hypothetical protein
VWSAQLIPTVVNLGFLGRSRYFFLPSSSLVVLTRLSGTPFQTRCFSENVEAAGIEPGTSGCVARNSDHRGGLTATGILS